MVTATCHTDGCDNAGFPIDVGDHPDDPDNPGVPYEPWVIVCGVCGQQIEDMSDAPPPAPEPEPDESP